MNQSMQTSGSAHAQDAEGRETHRHGGFLSPRAKNRGWTRVWALKATPLGRLKATPLGRLKATPLGRLKATPACLLAAITFAACGGSSPANAQAPASRTANTTSESRIASKALASTSDLASGSGTRKIIAVGAENEYANVISQIGGADVQVSSIISNPNTDPHSFEASASIAKLISSAKLVVQNGLGYDAFMSKIESASSNPARKVIDVQALLGLPDSTSNPHLWYEPATMPAVADAIARDLGQIQPTHASYFAANAARFIASLKPWTSAIDAFANRYPDTPVATTEPVGDYMLTAAGTTNRTPTQLQADIMNGVDPAPQDITQQENLLAHHQVKVLLYNQQVTDSLTRTFLNEATADHIPVVGLYETMPLHDTYQAWMLAEVQALRDAVAHGVSTTRL